MPFGPTEPSRPRAHERTNASPSFRNERMRPTTCKMTSSALHLKTMLLAEKNFTIACDRTVIRTCTAYPWANDALHLCATHRRRTGEEWGGGSPCDSAHGVLLDRLAIAFGVILRMLANASYGEEDEMATQTISSLATSKKTIPKARTVLRFSTPCIVAFATKTGSLGSNGLLHFHPCLFGGSVLDDDERPFVASSLFGTALRRARASPDGHRACFSIWRSRSSSPNVGMNVHPRWVLVLGLVSAWVGRGWVDVLRSTLPYSNGTMGSSKGSSPPSPWDGTPFVGPGGWVGDEWGSFPPRTEEQRRIRPIPLHIPRVRSHHGRIAPSQGAAGETPPAGSSRTEESDGEERENERWGREEERTNGSGKGRAKRGAKGTAPKRCVDETKMQAQIRKPRDRRRYARRTRKASWWKDRNRDRPRQHEPPSEKRLDGERLTRRICPVVTDANETRSCTMIWDSKKD